MFWFVLLDYVGKFDQIKAINAGIAVAMVRLMNADMCKFNSKIMDKSNCFWYYKAENITFAALFPKRIAVIGNKAVENAVKGISSKKTSWVYL